MYFDDFLRDYYLYGRNHGLEQVSGNPIPTDDRINTYFNGRVAISINNKTLQGKLVSVSNDGYEICLSLVYISIPDPGNIEIRNKVLTGIYEDQNNLIFIKILKYHNALRLTAKKYRQKLILK